MKKFKALFNSPAFLAGFGFTLMGIGFQIYIFWDYNWIPKEAFRVHYETLWLCSFWVGLGIMEMIAAIIQEKMYRYRRLLSQIQKTDTAMTDWAGNKISAGDTIVWVSFRYTPTFNALGFLFPYVNKGKAKFIPVKNPDQPRFQWKVISENKVVSRDGNLYYEEIQGDKRIYFQLEYPFQVPKHICLCIKGVSNYKSLFFEHYFNN